MMKPVGHCFGRWSADRDKVYHGVINNLSYKVKFQALQGCGVAYEFLFRSRVRPLVFDQIWREDTT